ncbi:MAG: hypothetical protein JNL08_00285 [Planctomycetes bacterium]|nr:hypothetical protein [Planctomycetota bacterium]
MHLAAALAAGLLLAASDHPLHFWWLQFMALVPFWWGLWRQRAARRRTWLFGLVFGLAYASVILLAAGLAPPVLAAAAANVLQWTFATWLCARHLERGPVRGPLAAAATLTLVEVALWHLVPVFGTAQAFVRPLSAAPMLVAFVAYTGVGGLVFVVAALQALLVAALRGPARGLPLALIASLLATVAALDAVRWNRPLAGSVRVAAFGWAHEYPNSPDGESFPQIAAAMAHAEGAQLLVTPESALRVHDRDAMLGFCRDLCRLHPLALVLGLWHHPTDDNRIWFVDATGELRGEYRKSHLVPFFEDYAVGDGVPVLVPFGDIRLGGMICQDDNFTDVARALGRAGVRLVAVPTNDWPAIREFHLENAAFRSIENGYAVVRAASDGISALVSPRGEVLARYDHTTQTLGGDQSDIGLAKSQRLPSAALLHGEVPLGDGVPTVYARSGDLPVLVGAAALLLLALRRRRAAA